MNYEFRFPGLFTALTFGVYASQATATIYVDGTMGGGGHSLGIAKRLTTGRLICIDQDPNAHEAAGKRLAEYKDRITFVRDNFGNIKSILDSLEIEKIDGMLLDIGVSSHQLDEAERGFSYDEIIEFYYPGAVVR